jgi:hypothetical protein
MDLSRWEQMPADKQAVLTAKIVQEVKQTEPCGAGWFSLDLCLDVSQTQGAELPAMREVNGDVGENHDRLLTFIEGQGIEVVFTEKIAPALGMSYGGRIAVLPGQSKAEEFSMLVNGLAHLCCVRSYVV